MSKRRRWMTVIMTLVLTFVASLCIWGPLFAYSPVVVGFHRQASSRAEVYYHNPADADLFSNLVTWMGEVEDFHGMQFRKPVQLIVCSSENEFSRLTGNCRARLVTFPPDGRIFMSARAIQDVREGKIHLDAYLKHELSHALLDQHTPLKRHYALPRWLHEGLATYSAGQVGCDQYLSRESIHQYLQQGYFINPEDCGHVSTKHLPAYLKQQPALVREPWFWYSESGCIVGDLIDQYGKASFFQFVNLTLQKGTVQADFQQVFGISFPDYIQDFRQRWSQQTP